MWSRKDSSLSRSPAFPRHSGRARRTAPPKSFLPEVWTRTRPTASWQSGVVVGAFANPLTDHVCKGNDDREAWADAEKSVPAAAPQCARRLTLFDGAPMLGAMFFPSTSGATCCCRLVSACG